MQVNPSIGGMSQGELFEVIALGSVAAIAAVAASSGQMQCATQLISEALRVADPTRPVIMSGFLPTSSAVRLSQWWRTRDQGDSLTVAARLADIVGIDYYSRHALMSLGPRTLYLAGADLPWQAGLRERRFGSIRTRGKRLMVAEGQAEPWETMTTPPNPKRQAMYSCPPEQLVSNYNAAIGWSRRDDPIYAYLFWGAEYWLLRDKSGDSSYLQAFSRILDKA